MATDALRDRHVARKAFCRLVLSRYLGLAPERIMFCRSPQGKPGLSPALQTAGLQFNASSSGPLAVIAVARGIGVGVDVELVRPADGMHGVAEWLDESFGHEGGAGDVDRDVALCRRWTRLEARAKCVGDGLALHEGRDDAAWHFRSMLQHRAGEQFVLTLATRRAVRMEGPFTPGPDAFAGARIPAPRGYAAPAGA